MSDPILKVPGEVVEIGHQLAATLRPDEFIRVNVEDLRALIALNQRLVEQVRELQENGTKLMLRIEELTGTKG